ncbi:ketosamine-3-kinase-like isoform X2 [Nerophis lumbriciformis]|uniref:ketosamine-3-kinase-like isoform X2 n=1 Tax=Nerophis lumbriciformis TaxID=546530 RepID=UPI002AE03E41|nr:ketosamine-3-kinase-like isoform X2 [Nerophis lumbriciformis]
MEAALKKELGTSMLKCAGQAAGGCISQGQSYDTDTGRVFVKMNHKSQAKVMFDGEMASLEAILKTESVKVPRPVKVFQLETGGCAFVMEHLDMHGLNKYSKQLGDQLAELHLHNKRQLEKVSKEQQTVGKGAGQSEYVDKFGFSTTTCCGYIAQENDWQDDWVTFFTRHRLQFQFNLLEESKGDREARELWAELQRWRLSPLSSTETCGEATWQNRATGRSSSTPLPSTAIQSMSWESLVCSEGLTTPFTPLTTINYPRRLALQRGTSFINFITT